MQVKMAFWILNGGLLVSFGFSSDFLLSLGRHTTLPNFMRIGETMPKVFSGNLLWDRAIEPLLHALKDLILLK